MSHHLHVHDPGQDMSDEDRDKLREELRRVSRSPLGSGVMTREQSLRFRQVRETAALGRPEEQS